jgi:hypothetical protein
MSTHLLQSQPNNKLMYQHPILAEVVHEVLVTRRKSFLLSCQDRFETEFEEDTSRQLPIPVVALAATAVSLFLSIC